MDARSERGAAAVELALLTPFLLLLLFAVVDFGYAYFLSTSVSHAAREGARVVALGGTADAAAARTVEVACGADAGEDCSSRAGLESTTATVLAADGSPLADDAACDFGQPVSVVAAVPLDYLTPMGSIASMFVETADDPFGDKLLTAKASMRCGG